MFLFVIYFFGKIMVCYFVIGYKEFQIEEFLEDLNFSLVLLIDWIIISGNILFLVDMLIAFLEKMNRDDVVEIIEKVNGRFSVINVQQGENNLIIYLYYSLEMKD